MLAKRDYNEKEAVRYFSLAALAYCEPEKIMAKDCCDASRMGEDQGIQLIFSDDNDLTINQNIYVIGKYEPEKKIIVAFSGTSNVAQFMIEAVKSYLTDYDLHDVQTNTRAVKYIDSLYSFRRKSFANRVMKVLEQYPDYSLVITGHSLGGAIATQAAIDCILGECVPEDNLTVYTFGALRIGNFKYSSILTNR